jgi:hypothetical protein
MYRLLLDRGGSPRPAPRLPAGFDEVDIAILEWIAAEGRRAPDLMEPWPAKVAALLTAIGRGLKAKRSASLGIELDADSWRVCQVTTAA